MGKKAVKPRKHMAKKATVAKKMAKPAAKPMAPKPMTKAPAKPMTKAPAKAPKY
jgi:hypothetical protein